MYLRLEWQTLIPWRCHSCYFGYALSFEVLLYSDALLLSNGDEGQNRRNKYFLTENLTNERQVKEREGSLPLRQNG